MKKGQVNERGEKSVVRKQTTQDTEKNRKKEVMRENWSRQVMRKRLKSN